jgi:hypothetical protein
MFDLERSISEWRRRMEADGVKPPKILEELECHLREEVARLCATGVPEVDAFRTATQHVGDGRELTVEFSKVRAGGISEVLDNPWQLNLLAAWLILFGIGQAVGPFGFLAWLFLRGGYQAQWHPLTLYRLLELLTIPMGVGLLRRRNFWRMAALVWSAWLSLGSMVGIALHPSAFMHFFAYNPPPVYKGLYVVLGLPIRYYSVFYAYLIIQLFMNTFAGLYVLTRPPIKHLFHAARDGGKSFLFRSRTWEERRRWGIILVGRCIMAVLLLWWPLRWICQNDLSEGEKEASLLALAFVGLAVWLGRKQIGGRLLSRVQSRHVQTAVRVATWVLALAWGMIFEWFVWRRVNLTFGQLTVTGLWAFAPTAALIGYWLGRGLIRIETAYLAQSNETRLSDPGAKKYV